ncbi:sugar kinase [Arthrobacter sp. NPDC058097]|uniref:sugar kinase n=1 Tax=Arthrobacter sp. NPDC058097 TaxID=3346340 RepID=UPI0036D7808B
MSPAVDLVTLGESMVSLRTAGPISAGGCLSMHVAGAESNVAVGAARLGQRVRWAGVVGVDPHGEFILRQLRGEGIDVRHREDAARSTGVMFLERRTTDVTRAYYYRSASAGSTLSREDVDLALQGGARVLHLTGITAALSPQAREAVEYAAHRAKNEGILVSLDVNYRSKLWSREEASAALARIVPHASVLIASDDELELVAPDMDHTVLERDSSGTAEVLAAKHLLAAGVREVVVKRGAAGAEVHTADQRFEVPAVPVTSIDTVGAGDAFTAGYLSALLDGEEVAGRLRRGALAGAFAVSTEGDWEGLPRTGELALLGDHVAGSTQR